MVALTSATAVHEARNKCFEKLVIVIIICVKPVMRILVTVTILLLVVVNIDSCENMTNMVVMTDGCVVISVVTNDVCHGDGVIVVNNEEKGKEGGFIIASNYGAL
jgi:hypothetical protein